VRVPMLILVFALAAALFLIGPSLLGIPFPPFPLMKIGDALDILTPLVLIPLYWLLYRAGRDERPARMENLAFVLLAALWVEGQGMHLSANSIYHWLEDAKDSDAFRLTFFYDELLGHYLWHIAVVGLSLVSMVRLRRAPSAEGDARWGLLILAGAIHGFTLFLIFVEGRTVGLGLLSAIFIAILGLGMGRSRLGKQPVSAFFWIAYLVAALFMVGWGMYWGGFPEFSEIGIID
jgi:hypothetical protein